MLTKKRSGQIIGLAVLSLALLQCSGDRSASTEENVGLPPSVTGDAANASRLITLSEEDASNLDIQVYTVGNEPFIYDLNTPATVFPAPDNIAVVSAPISGRVTEIYAHEGEPVKKGDALLRLQSLEYADLVASYLEMKAEEKYLTQQTDRIRGLVEKQISPQSSLDKILSDLSRARSRLRASEARLRAVGISENILRSWDDGSAEPDPDLLITAPISGILNQHLVDLGTSVAPNQTMLDIINNEFVLIRGYASPGDAAFVAAGTPVIFRQGAESMSPTAQSLSATVTSINPALDEMNRSIPVNTIVQTIDDWPVIGQNIRATYRITVENRGLSIPLSAVQYEGNDAIVFVRTSPTSYRKTSVRIAMISENSALVTEGLSVGDQVAVTQVFSLKALGKYEEFAD